MIEKLKKLWVPVPAGALSWVFWVQEIALAAVALTYLGFARYTDAAVWGFLFVIGIVAMQMGLRMGPRRG